MRGLKRRVRGFSMIEMTLVIALIGIMMAVAVFAFLPRLNEGRDTATKASMKTINGAMMMYNGKSSAFPTTLTQLVPAYLPTLPKDGWKSEFYYATPGLNGRPFDLVSPGPDKLPGTPDDIDWAEVEKE